MNNTKKENKKETVKIDLPEAMIEKLENLFKDVNSNIFKKILFTVYLINQGKYNNIKKKYEDYYELSSTHYKGYMSLNAKLSGILKTLVDNNIIAKIGGYTTGKSYQKYKMVDRYLFNENDKNIKTCFLTKEDGAYVGKYIADDYIVKYAVNKKSEMSVTKKKEVTEIPVENEVSQQVDGTAYDEIINKMKEEIKQLQNDLESVNKRVTEIELKEPSTAIEVEVYEIMAKHLTEEITYLNEVEDTLMNKNILDDDLDNDTGIESLVEAFALQEEQEAKEKAEFIKQQQQVETNIFDLLKYKNNLSAELTENVTNVIYRYTKSHQAVDKVIKILNEGKTVEKSDMLTFGVSGAIVNQMYTAFQAVI